jgi:hypothetical protein
MVVMQIYQLFLGAEAVSQALHNWRLHKQNIVACLCTVPLSSGPHVDTCTSIYIPSAADAVHGRALQMLLWSLGKLDGARSLLCCVPWWMQRRGSRRCESTYIPKWSSSTPFIRSIRSPTAVSAPSQALMRWPII